MEWRTELLEPQISPERLAELTAAIERIETLHWRGEATAEAIADFNTSTHLRPLEVIVAHPAPADVIFDPPAHLPDDAPPEDIVDEILKYRPIAL